MVEAKAFFEGLIDDAIEKGGRGKKALVSTGVLETAVK